MRNSVNVRVSCNNKLCDLVMDLPFFESSAIPDVKSQCVKCSSGILTVSALTPFDFQSSKKSHVSKLIPKGTQVFQDNNSTGMKRDAVGKHPIYTSINPDYKNNSPGGSHTLLTAFYNRYATGLVIMDVLRRMAGGDNKGGTVDVSDFLIEFGKTSQKLKVHLREIEGKHKIGRGERLSDAFPSSNSKGKGPMKIALKSWIGCYRGELKIDGGILMKIGILECKDAHTIVVTEYERNLSDLPSIEEHLLSSTKPFEMFGDSRPYLGCFYSPTISNLLLDKIEDILCDEYHHMMYVLGMIEKADGPNGWNSNFYAFLESDLLVAGKGHPRWGDRYKQYLQTARRYSVRNEDHAKQQEQQEQQVAAHHRMVKNINSTLGGLLGRSKELGLIYPVRSLSVKNVRITKFGKERLAIYRRNCREVEE